MGVTVLRLFLSCGFMLSTPLLSGSWFQSQAESSAMRCHWEKPLVKIAVWLCAEITLSLMGLDNLADYSEFVFQDRYDHLTESSHLVLVMTV
jgi:hypothetical protein